MSDIYAENHQNDPREPETPLKTQLEKARRLMIHVDGDRDWDVGSRLTVEQVLAIAEVCKNAHAYVLGMEGRASPPAQEAPAWRPISEVPAEFRKRLILCWHDSDTLPDHVELGWRNRDGSWRNTYDKAFSGAPTHFFDPASLSRSTTHSASGASPPEETVTDELLKIARDAACHAGCDNAVCKVGDYCLVATEPTMLPFKRSTIMIRAALAAALAAKAKG